MNIEEFLEMIEEVVLEDGIQETLDMIKSQNIKGPELKDILE